MSKPVLNRRQLLLAATAAGLMPAFPAYTREKARVIVIGGGMAGATLAKYLRKWGPNLQVTLIDRNARYTSCIMSSLVLSGQRDLASLQYDYTALVQKYGVKIRTDEVVAVDPVARSVTLGSGKVLRAERIVLAPGIEFDPVPGLTDPDAMPHAWKAGPQTTLLRQQLLAMQPGGTVVLTIPKVPYRCPPGPYERACLLADWLAKKKPGSKLLVLDANADFVTEKDNFSSAFFDLHGDVIEYRTSTEVLSADAATMTLQTSTGAVQGQVINLIPRQRCGSIVASAGLANATEGRFAGVNVLNYESTAAAGIHVIGDSSATTQPKAGHIANQEAKVCADAIVRAFAGEQPDPAPVTNSACFSTITMTKASWLHAGFQYNPATGQMAGVPTASGASIGWNADNFEQMNDWFRALMADTFA
ncbi:FAD-dependent oxidoreductase [Ideonella sp. 4Y11]|uniref:FAD-dependent oxidoreductase n=1 Tax=Ideonella aquatica TaxID=2824119 RepID=A0A940YKB0_9BURK|nr:FAD-dependent oxidoreductase [Ideonella aquatica]MBQ0957593.1 FAD-dependent oxidoreductase [Ideonella aquatica]